MIIFSPGLICDGNPLTAADLKKHFKSYERKYMGSFVTSRGMFFEEAELSDENIELFASIMKSTEERQSIFLRYPNMIETC